MAARGSDTPGEGRGGARRDARAPVPRTPEPPPAAGTAPLFPPPRKGPPYHPEEPLGRVRGIGPSWVAELVPRGVLTIGDLLDHLPFRYEDRRAPQRLAALRPGELATAIATITSATRVRTRRRGMEMLTLLVDDGSAALPVVFFNRSYLGDLMQPGTRILLHGTPRWGQRGIELHNPDFDLLGPDEDAAAHLGWIPVYEKLGPLSPRKLRAILGEVLDGLVAVADLLPEELCTRHRFPTRDAALRALHRPPPDVDAAALVSRQTAAHRRMAFEEFFFLELGLAIRRDRLRRERRVRRYDLPEALRSELVGVLPFTLTGAQQRALGEIWADLAAEWPMNRLLLGDVGSGKTALALLAMLAALRNGHQAALMAPTEILAQQHAATLQRLLLPAGIKVDLLCAGLPPAQQRDVRARLANGQARFVVGTHSLISEKVAFARLGLVVIDEQHRFGVVQRADLVGKGERPDVLVMSATPIPRTLAMVMYGDLDVSILDEKPPGRKPIRTVVRGHAERGRVIEGMRRALAEGRRIYIVRPAVEEGGAAGLKAAEEGLREYRALFPQVQVVMVHGRMGAADKQRNLEAFARGEAQVLVATTVIEVGIDVREASVMVVEDADRYGLAQLHQLRGRVGRGDLRSYCVLIASEDAAAEALARLNVLAGTDDGFRVAERDLELRGPGEFAGTAQSGMPSFHVADLVRHQDLLLAAREEAFQYVAELGERGVPPELRGETLRRHGERLRLAETA